MSSNNSSGSSFLSSVATGLASGGLGFIGNLISGYQTAEAQRRANRANIELAQYQFDKNLEMWNLQNEYNSPVNQMKRYKDAHLNPNLVYSKGTPGNAESAPSFSAPQIAPVTGAAQGVMNAFNMLSGVANQALDLKIKQSQLNAQNIANIREGIRAKRDSHFEADDTMLRGLQNTTTEQELQWKISNVDTIYGTMLQELKTRFEKGSVDAEFYREMQDLVIKKWQEEVLNLNERSQTEQAKRNLLDAQTQTEGSKKRKLDVESEFAERSLNDRLLQELWKVKMGKATTVLRRIESNMKIGNIRNLSVGGIKLGDLFDGIEQLATKLGKDPNKLIADPSKRADLVDSIFGY